MFHPTNRRTASRRERYDDGITGRAAVSLLSSVRPPVKERVFIATAMPWCRNGQESGYSLLYSWKLKLNHKNETVFHFFLLQ